MSNDKTKQIVVRTEWRSHHLLEVPEDWEWDGSLGALLEHDDLDSRTAELIDWEVTNEGA